MCYRNFSHCKTDTNMYAEAFYNKLKTFYLDSRPTKQLDDLINLLFKIEEDDYWRHKREVLYSTNPSIKKTENNRHEKELVIIDKDVEVINQKGLMLNHKILMKFTKSRGLSKHALATVRIDAMKLFVQVFVNISTLVTVRTRSVCVNTFIKSTLSISNAIKSSIQK